MIISKIVGGLGNQLFQYAVAKQLSVFLDQELFLDLSFFETYKEPDVFKLDKFNVHFRIASKKDIEKLKRKNTKGIKAKVFRHLFKRPYYLNNKYHFDPTWFRRNDWKKLKKFKDIYLSGYFGNPVLFYQIEDLLKEEFTLKGDLNKENKLMLNKIKKVESVMIHVRRGDYINNKFFVSLPISYYMNGIKKIKEKVKNPAFFVFSDDLEWTRKNLKIEDETHYVCINNSKTDYMELVLMSSCKHAIIANSTFSWWGEWLNNNPNKIIIYPEKWFSDSKHHAFHIKRKFYQEGWQRI